MVQALNFLRQHLSFPHPPVLGPFLFGLIDRKKLNGRIVLFSKLKRRLKRFKRYFFSRPKFFKKEVDRIQEFAARSEIINQGNPFSFSAFKKYSFLIQKKRCL